VVLVLDGSGVTTSPGTLDRFVSEYDEQLRTVNFKEIWWSDWRDFGLRRKLER
jgi:hypothetical protein